MNTPWRKVWRDVTSSKARTALVVVSMTIGLLALGLVLALSEVMQQRMTEDYRATTPAHISLGGGPFSREVIDAVRLEPGVVDVEGETETTFRWRREGDTEWRNGDLVGRPDFVNQAMNQIQLVRGRWPGERTLTLERQSAQFYGLEPGVWLAAEFGRREKQLLVEGAARSLYTTPPQFGGNATFYATPETVAWLTGMNDWNRIRVRMAAYGGAEAEALARRIEARLERMGVSVSGYRLSPPETHPLQDTINAVSMVLAALGVLALGLSAFLIINTISALIVQQVWQIGVMKVLGATSGRVVSIYLRLVLLYGLLAILLAMPVAALAGHTLAGWLLGQLNVERGPFRLVPAAAIVQGVTGILLPLGAAWVPVLAGARITVREAISSYGLGGGFGRGWLDRLIGHIRRLPRPLALSLRNTFRRKARVTLTLLTLVLGGVMFIMVMSAGSSLGNTLETLISDLGLDVWVVMQQPERATRLIEVAEAVPGVSQVEVWDERPADLALSNGEQRAILVMGVPPDSTLFKPRIVAGRALLPGDGHAILLNVKIADEEGFRVGDTVSVTVDGQEAAWTIVGLVLNVSEGQQQCFVPFAALSREVGTVLRGSVVMILSTEQDPAGQRALISRLREAYSARGMEPSFLLSSGEIRQQTQAQFNLILSLLLAMAVLAAIVGSLGLMGTMSINVLERSREVGVMRTIGATSFAITGIFVSEGVLLGLLSWGVALPLSYPGAQWFSQALGQTLLRVPLEFSYSLSGALIWLLLVTGLSALASFWPARRAAALRVVDALRFE